MGNKNSGPITPEVIIDKSSTVIDNKVSIDLSQPLEVLRIAVAASGSGEAFNTKAFEAIMDASSKIIGVAGDEARKTHDNMRMNNSSKAEAELELFTKKYKMVEGSLTKLGTAVATAKKESDSYNKLADKYEELSSKYSKLEKSFDDLESSRQNLEEINVGLKSTINILEEALDSANAKIEVLETTKPYTNKIYEANKKAK